MKLGEIIKIFREARGLSLDDFAKLSGRSKGYISYIERGINPRSGQPISPTADTLQALAQAMEISTSDLFDMLDDDQTITFKENTGSHKASSIPDDPNVFVPKLKKVPLLGTTAAGEPILSDEYFEGYVGTTANADFCLRVHGDSMTGIGIYDGDIVFVKSQNEAESGQVVVVRIDGDAVTLKRFYRHAGSVILQSENPAYPPMIFNANNCDDFRILGIAVIKQSIIQ
mgnify:CR=1 FL=1|jgi:repressor LexA|nr:MAG TPA: LexA repressor [Caudoviricetes sp.]